MNSSAIWAMIAQVMYESRVQFIQNKCNHCISVQIGSQINSSSLWEIIVTGNSLEGYEITRGKAEQFINLMHGEYKHLPNCVITCESHSYHQVNIMGQT